jgi:hypothetical protein
MNHESWSRAAVKYVQIKEQGSAEALTKSLEKTLRFCVTVQASWVVYLE